MTLQTVILAAGQSKRMKSNISKVMHDLCGRSVIDYVFETVGNLQSQNTILVTNPDMAQREWPKGIEVAVQNPARGTADALKCALPHLNDEGFVLVIFGDTPLILEETLNAVVAQGQKGCDVVVLGMDPFDPAGYGRLVVDENDRLLAIVEDRDLSSDQRENPNLLCNSGVMLIKASQVRFLLEHIEPNNAQGEYYLTDVVKVANAHGMTCGVIEGDEEEFQGINTREDLARISCTLQNRWLRDAMSEGVTLVDPSSVILSYDTVIAPDVTIHPHVVFGPGVTVEEGAEILPFCYLTDCHIGRHTKVGPFAHLRGDSRLEEKSEVGNFVELKKTTLGVGAKAKHLSYLGDALIDSKANIGAGTITCNYDGFNKFVTRIGEGAFVGTNCSLVAPLTIGAGAIIGAGSVITQDVGQDVLALTRSEQTNVEGGAVSFRMKRQKKVKG